MLPSWVGDAVMSTPVLRAVRNALPRTRVTGLMRPGIDQVLNGSPWLDELMVCDMRGVRGPMNAARAIRRIKPDAVLLLPNSFRSALTARLSGSSRRIGYARDGREWLLTHALHTDRSLSPISAVDYYARLAEWALGSGPVDRRLELAITPAEQGAADELLRDVPGRFVLLNPGANRVDKRWPAEQFAAVADHLTRSHGVHIVVSGSPGEQHVAQQVMSCAKMKVINLVERGITLGGLKAVIARAALLITNDTGPRHIAAALGTPSVVLFGPTDHRWTTLDHVRERRLLAEPFLPEELIADRHRNACAIEKISRGDVIAAAESLLNSVAGADVMRASNPAGQPSRAPG